MSLTVSGSCRLSLSLPFSCSMSLTVPYCCWLSHTVSSSAIEFLHVSLFLLLCLAVSNNLSGYMEFLHVFHCLFYFYRVAACPSPSPIVAGCLSLSLPVPWKCCMSLTLSMVAGCLSMSPRAQGDAACLSLSPVVTGCLSLSLSVLFSSCMSHTVSYGCWLSLLVPWSCCVSLTVSFGYRLSLTVSTVQ